MDETDLRRKIQVAITKIREIFHRPKRFFYADVVCVLQNQSRHFENLLSNEVCLR